MSTTTALRIPITPKADDLVPILFYVPSTQALTAQMAVRRFLDGAEAAPQDGPYKPPNSNTYGPKNAWDLPPWEGDERDAAEWITGVVGTNQRRILVSLVAAGPEGAWTGELRHSCGYDGATSLSGVFKAIGGRFRSVGLRPVWNGGEKDSQRGQRLSVPDGPARALFGAVIKARFPELAAELGVD